MWLYLFFILFLNEEKNRRRRLINRTEFKYNVVNMNDSNQSAKSQGSEIVLTKIKWLYENSVKYQKQVDDLLSNAQDDIVSLFFQYCTTKKF